MSSKIKKPNKKTLRNKADRLLQEYIRIKHKGETCYLCGVNPVSVGHHFIYKSQSLALRYVLDNIIPLCNNCHCLIHNQPSRQNARICFKRGEQWFNDLEEVRKSGAKFTKEWIETKLQVLEILLAEIN